MFKLPNSSLYCLTPGWARTLTIILFSFITSVILIAGGKFSVWMANYLHVPVKWVVLALVSLMFTLLLGPDHLGGKHEA